MIKEICALESKLVNQFCEDENGALIYNRVGSKINPMFPIKGSSTITYPGAEENRVNTEETLRLEEKRKLEERIRLEEERIRQEQIRKEKERIRQEEERRRVAEEKRRQTQVPRKEVVIVPSVDEGEDEDEDYDDEDEEIETPPTNTRVVLSPGGSSSKEQTSSSSSRASSSTVILSPSSSAERNVPIQPSIEYTQDARCKLPLDQGPCRTYIIKWYYDKQANSCAQFWYGGCSGNGNRFNTEEECKKSCVYSPDVEK